MPDRFDPRDDNGDRRRRSDWDRDDAGVPSISRGSSSTQTEVAEGFAIERERRPERHEGRTLDPRDVFMHDVDLPRGTDRERVYDARGREYSLRGSETRTLATVGAFRVVSAGDLRDRDGRPADARSGDVRHLREQGLIRTERLPGHRDAVVVLTKQGRDLLHAHQRMTHGPRQAFYAGLVKPREVEHDAQVYKAYLREAAPLAARGARLDRVVLDYELKRDYQQWRHRRDRPDEDGHHGVARTPDEVAAWARAHELPYFDDQVHVPDVRIEYEDVAGRLRHVDVEVVTEHYRGAHRAAAARSGFSCYRGVSATLGAFGGGGRGSGHGASRVPNLAEDMR